MASDKKGGLAILIGKHMPSKDMGGDDGEEESDDGEHKDLEDDFLMQAHEALKDDDVESFTRSMKGAIKACVEKELKGQY